jgi:TusA-related sulfurtransferase
MSVTPKVDPAATLDACDLTCGSLEPHIAQRLRALAPGDVLEILSNRSESAEGIRAWVSLTGHTLVAVTTDESSRLARYFVRKKAT